MKIITKTSRMALCLTALLVVSGCEDAKELMEKQKIDKCTEMGGIPILSAWDSRLSDCIFQPS